MMIKDFNNREHELINKRVWNIQKTIKGTVVEILMHERDPMAVIKWDDKTKPNSCYFVYKLNNEIIS